MSFIVRLLSFFCPGDSLWKHTPAWADSLYDQKMMMKMKTMMMRMHKVLVHNQANERRLHVHVSLMHIWILATYVDLSELQEFDQFYCWWILQSNFNSTWGFSWRGFKMWMEMSYSRCGHSFHISMWWTSEKRKIYAKSQYLPNEIT